LAFLGGRVDVEYLTERWRGRRGSAGLVRVKSRIRKPVTTLVRSQDRLVNIIKPGVGTAGFEEGPLKKGISVSTTTF
jgi:hypothetical protein